MVFQSSDHVGDTRPQMTRSVSTPQRRCQGLFLKRNRNKIIDIHAPESIVVRHATRSMGQEL